MCSVGVVKVMIWVMFWLWAIWPHVYSKQIYYCKAFNYLQFLVKDFQFRCMSVNFFVESRLQHNLSIITDLILCLWRNHSEVSKATRRLNKIHLLENYYYFLFEVQSIETRTINKWKLNNQITLWRLLTLKICILQNLCGISYY